MIKKSPSASIELFCALALANTYDKNLWECGYAIQICYHKSNCLCICITREYFYILNQDFFVRVMEMESHKRDSITNMCNHFKGLQWHNIMNIMSRLGRVLVHLGRTTLSEYALQWLEMTSRTHVYNVNHSFQPNFLG